MSHHPSWCECAGCVDHDGVIHDGDIEIYDCCINAAGTVTIELRAGQETWTVRRWHAYGPAKNDVYDDFLEALDRYIELADYRTTKTLGDLLSEIDLRGEGT